MRKLFQKNTEQSWNGEVTILLGMTPKSLRYQIWKKAEKEMTKVWTFWKWWHYRIMFSPGYMKNKYPIQAFEDNISYHSKEQKCLFRLVMMLILALPLVIIWHHLRLKKQVPHHDAVIADMDKSYREYMGEYNARKKLVSLFQSIMWRNTLKINSIHSATNL